jgi:TolB-like protein
VAPVKEAPSIAVLPFASMSPDPENEYFSDGISEEIINALTQIEGLRVAARTSSFWFKGKSVEFADIARRLTVRHVLEGSVRKAGLRVRVMAHLVDASNGFSAETMPAALEAATRATVADPESAEAHNALAVSALLWERDFGKAEREFLEALALNPKYVQARCWYGLFFLQWGVGRSEDGLTQARLAFEADPLSAYATTVLSLALATAARLDDAVLQARNAVQQDPESFLAQWTLGCAYHWNGRHEEAIGIFEPLWANSRNNWVAMGLVPAYAAAGHEDRARSLYQSLLALQAREYVQPFVLAVSATALNEHEAAIGFCEAAIEGCDMLFALFHRWWPDFERVRADRRYDDILVRFNSRGRTPP